MNLKSKTKKRSPRITHADKIFNEVPKVWTFLVDNNVSEDIANAIQEMVLDYAYWIGEKYHLRIRRRRFAKTPLYIGSK